MDERQYRRAWLVFGTPAVAEAGPGAAQLSEYYGSLELEPGLLSDIRWFPKLVFQSAEGVGSPAKAASLPCRDTDSQAGVYEHQTPCLHSAKAF